MASGASTADYQRELKELRENARNAGFSESEVEQALENSFVVAGKTSRGSRGLTIVKATTGLLIILWISMGIVRDCRYLTGTVQTSLQNFIYPGLKLWRKLALPIIGAYPSLSELYDEWCLVENPAFYVNEMDCWPCSVANFVPDLTNSSIPTSFDPGIAYCKTEDVPEVRIDDISRLVDENRRVFERDARNVVSNNQTYKAIIDLLENGIGNSTSSMNHVSWRINRMEPARIVRQVFPNPKEVPKWFEQSVERFILFDESDSPPYSLPSTECANVMVRAAVGTRLIRIVASPECRPSCEPKTVLLSPGKILWYNWWYWRPVSLPAGTSALSITYILSFC